MTTRLDDASALYAFTFRIPSPMPWGVSDERLAMVLEQAAADGKPIGVDFDWYDYLPPDALA